MTAALTDWLSAGALVVSAAAFTLSAIELRGTRRATSAALYLSLAESMRKEWEGFDEAGENLDKQEDRLSEILNLVEAGCACENDGAFAGRTRKILRNVIDDIQDGIENNPNLQALASKLTTHQHTFEESEIYRARRKLEREKTARKKANLTLP